VLVLKPGFLLAALTCLSIPAHGLTRAELASALQAYEVYAADLDPVRAGARGNQEALRRWPDNSPAAVDARRRKLLAIRGLLGGSPDAPDPEAALNAALLRDRVEIALEGLSFDEERIPFLNGEGFYTLAETAAATTALASLVEAQAWIARLEILPQYYAREIANMRRGMATGFTQPRIPVETAIAAMTQLAGEPADRSALLLPLDTLPAVIPTGDAERLRARAIAVIAAKVRPAQAELALFFREEYLPRARSGLGASSLPGGRDYYAYLVRKHTTTRLTPDEIHAIGVGEIERIKRDFQGILPEVGFTGSLREFSQSLRTDPRFQAADEEDYYEKTSAVLKRADYLLPRWFGTLPRLPYGIIFKAPGLDSISSGYFPGSAEQGVAGAVVLSTSGSNFMPLYSLPAWAAHEGVPGHHLQITLAQERTDLPGFRRADDVTAFVEGWALYSESLAGEMGLYRTPYERFGKLSMEMWRACRLIMDTGIHWLGWEYERARSCLQDNTALLPATVSGETSRYVGWPGQALAYKIGELEILRLRREAREALGEKFDIRDFHDRVLVGGPMPLELLSAQVMQWIDGQRSAAIAGVQLP
jgi:uncharacterized protein (DUF885 family)